jgi:hypothetical protein
MSVSKVNVDSRDIAENTQVVQLYETMFDVLKTPELIARDFARLSAGTLGSLHLQGLISPARCAEIMELADRLQFDTYDEKRIYPPVTKFGPSAYDYYLNGAFSPDYWEQAEQSDRLWRQIAGDDDPVESILDRFRVALGTEVSRAQVGGRPLFAGMLREFSDGGRMHFDELAREFPGILDDEPIVQFGFNCHLSVPSSGGELTVYRRRWRPDDDRFRIGYGWDEKIAEREPAATTRALVGDGVLFDSRNYHSIAPCGPGRRVTLSFFVGVTLAGRVVVWS